MASKLHSFGTVFTLLILVIVSTLANESKQTALQKTTDDSYKISSLLSWIYSSNLALSVTAVTVSATVIGIIIFFYPLLIYQICYVLGGCQNTLDNYINDFLSDSMKDNIQRTNQTRRETRNVETNPVLLALSNAHKRYEQSGGNEETFQKNIKNSPFLKKLF